MACLLALRILAGYRASTHRLHTLYLRVYCPLLPGSAGTSGPHHTSAFLVYRRFVFVSCSLCRYGNRGALPVFVLCPAAALVALFSDRQLPARISFRDIAVFWRGSFSDNRHSYETAWHAAALPYGVLDVVSALFFVCLRAPNLGLRGL